MRFLGIGDTCDLGDMYYRLGQAGHEVRVYVEEPAARDIFGGMIQLSPDWRMELPWIREVGQDGILIFESAGMGEIQDSLRRDGYQVIGGSAYGDRLESDREFGQQVFRDIGLQTATSYRFTDYDAAMQFVQSTPGRYVFKANGASALRTRNYVGELESGADVIALLALHKRQWLELQREGKATVPPDFVLMQHVTGIEVGVGAYFNGVSFLQPACLDWEHKRFFPGSQGELTGEMGTVVSFRGSQAIFDLTLARLAPELQKSGYCGYININLIANQTGLWPLEFTSRFGYPGFAICQALQLESWPVIFQKMLSQQSDVLATRDGFATGVVLTVPPFPYSHGYAELSKGAPVLFRDSITAADFDHLHMAEVALVKVEDLSLDNVGVESLAIETLALESVAPQSMVIEKQALQARPATELPFVELALAEPQAADQKKDITLMPDSHPHQEHPQLIASGMTGYLGVAVGVGASIEAACEQAYTLANKVVAPNIRYRNDIGQRLLQGEYSELQALGYLS